MKTACSLLLLLLLGFGCKRNTSNFNIKAGLTDSNHSLHITGFDQLIINDIGRDSSNEVWQSLLPVYKMPADTDMKDYQNAQPGKYSIRDSVVVFTPDTPFKQGQLYFVRYFRFDDGKSAWQYIREKKRPGALTYKDLLFKY